MGYIHSKVIRVTLITLTLLSLSFAQEATPQEATPEEYIVRTVYFLPRDRNVRQGIDVSIDKTVKRTQRFFAYYMERFGFGRKTFRYEADENGDVLVHHVIGKKDASAYQKNVYSCFGEFAGRIQTRNTILLVYIDHGSDNVGGACGLAFTGRRTIIPASGGCYSWQVTAHELGHNFVLQHDFRVDGGVMGGPGDGLSQCAAEWLNKNPYFSGGKISEIENGVKIEMLTTVAYPPDNLHVFFEFIDPDDLYHVRFLHETHHMHGCASLSGERMVVQYDMATVKDKKIKLQTIDSNGNARYPDWLRFKDVEPAMILDISLERPDVDDGLIGYWTFDEAGGKYAFDASDNSRYARLSDGAALAFNEGKIGGALKNDGSRDNATVVDSAELINGLDAFSLCFWVKSNITHTDRGFINGRTPNDKDEFFGFRYNKDGRGGGENNVIKAGITTTSGSHSLESSGNVQTKEWQHLAFTWRSGEPMKLYINGVLDNPSFIQPAISGTLSNVDKLVIGRGGKDRRRGWNGLIDDVRLYNKVLSAREIAKLPRVNNREASAHGVALTGVVNLTPEAIDTGSGIQYVFTVTNTGTTNDTMKLTTSGNVTATLSETSVSLTPGASSVVRLTVPGTTLATAGEYVVDITATSQGDTTKTAQLTATTTVSVVYGVSLKVVDSLETERLYVGQGTDYTLTVTNISTTDDTIQLTTSVGTAVILSKTSVSLAPGASSKVTLTIPGTALSVPGGYVVQVTATSGGDSEKTAQIETITYVYPSSIEAVDIQNGLIGYWSFDEGQGDTAVDASGNGNDLTKTGSSSPATWAPTTGARIGNSAFYNDKNDRRVYFWTEEVDFINGLWAFSLSLWVKSRWPDTDRGFVVGKVSGGNDALFSFRYDSDGYQGGKKEVIKAGITTTEGTHAIETSARSTSTDWQHLVFTWSSGGKINVYIDGVLDTLSHTDPALAGTITDIEAFSIGRGWVGYIDDVHLYNRPLTHTEIVALAAEHTTASFPTPTYSYGVTLSGVGDLTNQTQDASAGITYYFTVSNTGDTEDTIKLATSGDATATLSHTSVSLAPGASSEVTITVVGSALTVPGEYGVKVTATSQGDRTKTVELDTTTTIYPKTRALPNFPNPCNPETWIPYHLGKPSDVKITIYAMSGEVVRTLALGHKLSGSYQTKGQAAYWDGTNEHGETTASGVYFYKFAADDFSAVRKMLVLK